MDQRQPRGQGGEGAIAPRPLRANEKVRGAGPLAAGGTSGGRESCGGSQTHYPFYVLVLDSKVFDLSCFQIVDGPDLVGPGTSSGRVRFRGRS